LSGYPWIMKIPILKYLFGQETKERAQSEIVFAITPHIIRGSEVTDENLKAVDLGSGTSVTYRRDDSKVAAAASLPAVQPTPQPEKPAANPPTAKAPMQSAPKSPAQPTASANPPAQFTAEPSAKSTTGTDPPPEPASRSSLQPIARTNPAVRQALPPPPRPAKPLGIVRPALV